MLEEVLLGQTGSGKTFTMEGDLSDVQGYNAGIIPRTLYQLFNRLEYSKTEYSFRVSYVELYNEELKDLLSVDEIATDTTKPEQKKLKIFDDLNRKGSVLIQGLEEVLVKNCEDVISILQRGASKRQTASTKMNESSSRSHCIFSITVHIKEATSDGEELLKIGKLNLVDLAGSENIGRSGALDKRAVEAGKTKTCIIAAVSPAKSNIEESISTLDYAHRAKNIRNKPEINQKMTKKTLIREYVNEIERLKADLNATREKNGVFMSQQNYQTLMEDNLCKSDQLEDFSKILQQKEELFNILELKHKENIQLLSEKNVLLDIANAELEEKKIGLRKALDELSVIERRFREQKLLSNVYAKSEKRLHSLASGLSLSLDSTVNDLEGLFNKIERKKNLENDNLFLFKHFQLDLLKKIQSLDEILKKMKNHSLNYEKNLELNLYDLVNVEENNSSNYIIWFNSFLNKLTSFQVKLQVNKKNEHTTFDSIFEEFMKDLKNFAHEVGTSLTEIDNDNAKCTKSFDHIFKLFEAELSSWMVNLQTFLRNYLECEQNDTEKQFQLCTINNQNLHRDIDVQLEEIKNENTKLRELIKEERIKSKKRNEDIKRNFLAALEQIEHENEETLLKISNIDNESSERNQAKLNTLKTKINSFEEELLLNNTKLKEVYASNLCILEESFKYGFEKNKESFESLKSNFCSHQDALKQNLLQFTDFFRKSVGKFDAHCEKGLKTGEEFKIQFEANLNENKNFFEKQKSSFDDTIDESHTNFTLKTKEISNLILENSKTCSEIIDYGLKENIEELTKEINFNKLEVDRVTGYTPKKKFINVPKVWKLAAPHTVILSKYRKRKGLDEDVFNDEEINSDDFRKISLISNNSKTYSDSFLGVQDANFKNIDMDSEEDVDSFFVDVEIEPNTQRSSNIVLNEESTNAEVNFVENSENMNCTDSNVSTPFKTNIISSTGSLQQQKIISKLPRALKRNMQDTPFKSRVENFQD
ncbi:Kinesin- protein 11 [Clydaea vesicula]|uniref:Kinesin-like protein n=1 Tax=Clydaea vesicula TaxID=447962 RepID=A0AAD5XU33_9FUNG|nr:Kinesin- protein 11 [Clydaea vesicula]